MLRCRIIQFDMYVFLQAASNGGLNIDPSFRPDPNNPGSSLYPAQVRHVRIILFEGVQFAFIYL